MIKQLMAIVSLIPFFVADAAVIPIQLDTQSDGSKFLSSSYYVFAGDRGQVRWRWDPAIAPIFAYTHADGSMAYTYYDTDPSDPVRNEYVNWGPQGNVVVEGNQVTWVFDARLPASVEPYTPGIFYHYAEARLVLEAKWLAGAAPTQIWMLTDSDVPEPSVWAMLIVGFGTVGSAMRSRRRCSAVG